MTILKSFVLGLCALVMVIGISPFARASDLIMGGQQHDYKVILRGDGRAIVLGKLIAPNESTESVNSMTIGLSVDDAVQVTAYQVLVQQTCASTSAREEILIDDMIIDSNVIDIGVDEDPSDGRACTKYRDVSARDITNANVEKITITEGENNTYTLSLPSAIAPGRSAVVLFAYSSTQYANNFLGLLQYKFVTPTVDERIEKMSVTIQTDSDLVLRGGSTTIQYDDNANTTSLSESAALSSADMLYSTMNERSGNTVIEKATNLFPGESYTVKGKYSEHWWRLYAAHIALIVLVLAVIIALFVRKHRGNIRGELVQTWRTVVNNLFGGAILSGLVSAGLIGAWTTIVTYARPFENVRSEIAEPLLMVVILMVFVLVGIGPTIVVGMKRGPKAAMITFVSTIIWLIIGIYAIQAMDLSSDNFRFLD